MISHKVLEFIYATTIEHEQVCLSTRDIGAIAAIDETLHLQGVSDPDLAAAATIAEVLPSVDNIKVTAVFGSNAGACHKQLHEAVTKVLFGGLRFVEMPRDNVAVTTVVMRASDPLLRAGAQAILAARVATCSERDRGTLQDDLDSLLEHYKQSPSIVAELSKRLKNRPVHDPAPAEPFWMISVSIDVVGSTEGKTKIVALAADDKQRHDTYKGFINRFLFHESRFYENIFHGGRAPCLDWRRFFVVKAIGDEIWSLYRVPKGNVEELREATDMLVRAGLELAKESIMWVVAGEEDDDGHLRTRDTGEIRRMDHPFKVYIDLVEDAHHFTEQRLAYLQDQIGRYQGRYQQYKLDDDGVTLMNRLNASQSFMAGSRVIHSYRSDYIGHEIDRFFRTTKGALPMTVTIGQALWDKLELATAPTEAEGVTRVEWPNAAVLLQRPIDNVNSRLALKKTFKAGTLKGLDRDYHTYTIVTRGHIGTLYRGAIFTPHLVADTKRAFTRNVWRRLLTREEFAVQIQNMRQTKGLGGMKAWELRFPRLADFVWQHWVG